ncbi:hypothetical protein RFI_38783 [Reticulomyxa filosa]|uniref:Uncharacterized protein n=1 Tax=Reticulomyxa filosa TaxID=46433 RepID=X6LD79_RETFI|nr:hypothetical protein RFI_38783 [Reticulomyxa filosa]|eukprot:ETN98709.1 hypothetical protein RFI_38783 [Reticulomyxa filosa]
MKMKKLKKRTNRKNNKDQMLQNKKSNDDEISLIRRELADIKSAFQWGLEIDQEMKSTLRMQAVYWCFRTTSTDLFQGPNIRFYFSVKNGFNPWKFNINSEVYCELKKKKLKIHTFSQTWKTLFMHFHNQVKMNQLKINSMQGSQETRDNEKQVKDTKSYNDQKDQRKNNQKKKKKYFNLN